MDADDPFLGVRCLYVDAMNVIGSRPDGWWRDRDGAVRRLAARLQSFGRRSAVTVVLVVDGRPVAGLPEGTDGAVVVRYARRSGPDAADDLIIELLGGCADAATSVVTADRELGRRAGASGARTLGPLQLLAMLDQLPELPD